MIFVLLQKECYEKIIGCLGWPVCGFGRSGIAVFGAESR
jgi:hypothetical protein